MSIDLNEEVALKVNNVYVTMWFSCNEAMSENCDACIGYNIYNSLDCNPVDGGEMDYNSEEKGYESIGDAIEDVLSFIFAPSYEIINNDLTGFK